MGSWILRLNHFLFPWYYKRCGDHFKRYTLFKSIKLLIENYEHNKELLDSAKRVEAFAIKEADRERNERVKLQMRLLASDKQIDWANNTFGTNFSKSSEN